MKAIFILIASILIVTTIYAQTEDSVFVVISGDTVHIWNTGAYENCGCLFRMDVLLSNDTIYVTEVDTTSDWAFCMCSFDLCASVTGFQNGTYMVNVSRYMPLFYPDTIFYIGSTSFTYGGSVLASTSTSFQSECYNITEAGKGEEQPEEFGLEQNYPNPFNPTTNIKFSIPNFELVVVKIYDVLGREVTTLVNEEKSAGTYELTWNSINLPSGVYCYQLQAGSVIETKKMVLIK